MVEDFFKTFGDITSVRFVPNVDHTFGFVQFDRAEAAGVVLSRPAHKINGQFVRVKAADSWHQPGWRGVTLPLDDEADEVADVDPCPELNDDCLHEIFDYLNVWDLVSVADVCTRFEQVAQTNFSKKHKTFEFSDFVMEGTYADKKLPARHMRQFFKHFGSLIVDLSISYYEPVKLQRFTNFEILMAMVEHCGESLNVLRLFNFIGRGRIVTILRPLFGRLKKLYMDSCHVSDEFIRSLENCRQLTKLKIIEDAYDRKFNGFNYTLPALTTLSLKRLEHIRRPDVIKILQHNPQLKRITISACTGLYGTTLDDIVQYVPLVEKVAFKQYSYYVRETKAHMGLAQLTSLKTLKLDDTVRSIGKLLNQMATVNVPLEHLTLRRSMVDDEFVNAIGGIKTLRSLYLIRANNLETKHLQDICELLPKLAKLCVTTCDGLNANGLVKLMRKAKELEEIDLYKTGIVFTDELFKRLVQTVVTRRIPLKITAMCESSMFGVSQELLDAHKDNVVLVLTQRSSDYGYDDEDDDEDDDDDYDYDDDDDDSDYGFEFGMYSDDDDDDVNINVDIHGYNLDEFIWNLLHHI